MVNVSWLMTLGIGFLFVVAVLIGVVVALIGRKHDSGDRAD